MLSTEAGEEVRDREDWEKRELKWDLNDENNSNKKDLESRRWTGLEEWGKSVEPRE